MSDSKQLDLLPSLDLSSLEGWLLKEKTKPSRLNSIIGSESRRWFKIQEVAAADGSMHELALVYFQTDRSKDAKGWIFLKDVSEIVEDGDSFKIVSYARTLVLQAPTRAEHRFWVRNLVQLAINAVYKGSTLTAGEYSAILDIQDRNRALAIDSEHREEGRARARTDSSGGGGGGGGNSMLRSSAPRADGETLGAAPSAPSDAGSMAVQVDSRGSDYSGSHNKNIKAAQQQALRNRVDHRKSEQYAIGVPASTRLHDHISGRNRSPSPGGDSWTAETDYSGERNEDNPEGTIRRRGSREAKDSGESKQAPPKRRSKTESWEDEPATASSAFRRSRNFSESAVEEEETVIDDDLQDEADAKPNKVAHIANDPTVAGTSAPVRRKLPPPSAPPPRRAREVLAAQEISESGILDSSYAAPKRASIEMLLNRESRAKLESKSSSDDPEDDVDFIRIEKRNYKSKGSGPSLDTSTGGNNSASIQRPPLAPVAPSSSQAAVLGPAGQRDAEATSATARPHGQGLKTNRNGNADANFAESNWDSSSDSENEGGESKSIRNSNPMSAQGKHDRTAPEGRRESKTTGSNRFLTGVIGEGVKPDTNWLEEDFDN